MVTSPGGRKQLDGITSFETRACGEMADDLRRLDALRTLFRESIRASKSAFRKPDIVLADPFLAALLGLCVVPRKPVDLLAQ